MRVWGRTGQVNGIGGTWTLVQTDANGFNGNVYLTNVVQVLKLSLGESPIFGSYGIPGAQSVITQVVPDFYAAATQTQFSPQFASLSITRVRGSFPPTYNVAATFIPGTIASSPVAT
jgi:hypothetical protein